MRIRLGLVILLLAGCASWPMRSSTALLAKADEFAERGDYASALRTYDEVLKTYPDDDAAGRARATRPAVAALVVTREEIERLRRDLTEREARIERLSAELSRTRQDLAARQAEVTRLTLEAERMRADLESLKRIEMRMEKRR